MRTRNARLVALIAAGLMIGSVPAANSAGPASPRQQTASAAQSGIPTPEEFFGFRMGAEGKLAEFPDIEEYLRLIADESSEVEYEVVGTTTEDNDFPILRIGSEQNLGRLDEILDVNARLADPEQMQQEADEAGKPRDQYARELASTSVPVYYVEAGIHSTEVGNTQALMDVVHRFATEDSEYTDRVLKNLVAVVVPSQNPDGHNRVVDYYNETAGTDYNRVFPDLYQKYVGHDNNRDWFMFTQKESRIRLKLEQKYRPAVQHYMHQAGTDSPRIWSPPWDEPMSPTLDPLTIASANSIGQESNRDLVSAGKKGAKTDDAYGIMWNADVMGYSTFQGTTTWLTEIASAKDLWSTFTSDDILEPSTSTLRSPLPYDKKTWRPEQIVDYAKTAAYSGLETVAGNPQEWLYNNMYRVNANSQTWDGGPYAYVVPKKQRDPYAVYDLLRIFDMGKVRIEQATRPFRAGGARYPKGSWILRTNQPLGRWVDQLLRVDEYPESARKCETCPLVMPYSETTDNLGLLMGVTVDPVAKKFPASTRKVTGIEPSAPPMPPAPGPKGAYLVGPSSYGLGKTITALESAGIATYRAAEPVGVAGTNLPPGALVVPATDEARTVLEKSSAETGLPVYAANSVPRVPAIKLADTTRVGLIRGMNNMQGGWMMWMLDQYGVDYEVVEARDYDNLGKFDTIVLPPGISRKSITEGIDPAKYPKRFHWARGVPRGPQKLNAYVKRGGNLVAIGNSSQTAATALSLPVENVAPDDEEEVFEVPGSLLKQTFRPASPAAWGMRKSWPVWYYNDPAFDLTGDGEVAASYPRDPDLLVSGYARGDEALSGASNVATFDVGKGQSTIVGGQITFRTWPRAAWTVVTNAMYNGAGTPVSGRQLARDLG